MALITWNNNFSVNVLEIDQQHKKLVAMINELAEAMKARKAKESLGKIISGLIGYTATHFALEEKYFAQFKYPDTAMHKKEHQDFVKKVKDFQQGFEQGKLMLSMEIIEFLQNWLINHIQGSDKQYSSFFNAKGLK